LTSGIALKMNKKSLSGNPCESQAIPRGGTSMELNTNEELIESVRVEAFGRDRAYEDTDPQGYTRQSMLIRSLVDSVRQADPTPGQPGTNNLVSLDEAKLRRLIGQAHGYGDDVDESAMMSVCERAIRAIVAHHREQA
jgi:hypothetical protein